MRRRLALLIATYEYQDTGLRRLAAPAHDAEALGAVLQDPAIAGFEVSKLINEPHRRVWEAIGDFYHDCRKDDLTLLYFTGHGLKDIHGQLYLAMADTRRDRLPQTAISAEQIDQAMTGSASRQNVLILDCCYSGAFPSAKLAKATKADAEVHALERFSGRGRTVLTASDAMQYAFEGDSLRGQAPQSLFTRFLVEGLRDGSADLNNDGDITLDELYEYVHNRVVEVRPEQRPKRQDDVEGHIHIARNVNWRLPPLLSPTISSPIAAERLAALDELRRVHDGGNELVRSQVLDQIRRLTADDSRMVSTAAQELMQELLPPPQQSVVGEAPPALRPSVTTTLGGPSEAADPTENPDTRKPVPEIVETAVAAEPEPKSQDPGSEPEPGPRQPPAPPWHSRRKALLAAGAAVLAAVVGIAVVVDKSDSSQTNDVGSSAPTSTCGGPSLHGLAVSHDGHRLYAATETGYALITLKEDGSAASVTPFTVGRSDGLVPVGDDGVQGLAVGPDGHLYVAYPFLGENTLITPSASNATPGEVTAVRGSDGRLTKKIVISPDGSRRYVSHLCPDGLTVVDTTTSPPTTTEIKISGKPVGVALNPDRHLAYVALNGKPEVSVVDTITDTLLTTSYSTTHGDPLDIAVSPNGELLYVSDNSSVLSIFDTGSNQWQTLDLVTIGNGAIGRAVGNVGGLALSPDGSRLYVSAYDGSVVAVLDTKTRQFIETLIHTDRDSATPASASPATPPSSTSSG